jgi:hypothetical protein
MQTGARSGYGSARIFFVSSITEYAFTGAVQQKTVTSSRVQIEVWGAQGGGDNGWSKGGYGGYGKAIFNVTSGQTLYIYVGGMNGWNGGGGGFAPGGGATDIRLGGTTLTDRIIVAGGGGAASPDLYAGGAGGGLSGTVYYDGVGGGAGTQTAGGAGIPNACSGSSTPGTFGQGGNGGICGYTGGGGGGGWYGGGGGKGAPDTSWAIGGGGGGSGYIRSDGAYTEMQTGVHSGNGYVRITELN